MGGFVCKIKFPKRTGRGGGCGSISSGAFEGIRSGRPHHGGVSKYSEDDSNSEGEHGRGQGAGDNGPSHHDRQQDIGQDNHPDEMDDYGEASQLVDRPIAVEQGNPVLLDSRIIVTHSSESISWNGAITITRSTVMTSSIEANSDAHRTMQEQLGVADWA